MQAIDASENVDFNLHTHVECNSPLLPDSKTIVISTHALTWSATESSAIRWRNRTDFNSRTHVECAKDASEMWDHNRISTHALTWSATTRVTFLCLLIQFQLTHSRGVRPAAIGSSSGGREFQLTHSRGVRLLTG